MTDDEKRKFMLKNSYKYMSLDIFKQVIQNQTVRITCPLDFNDPFDSLHPNVESHHISSVDTVREMLIEHYNVTEEELEKAIVESDEKIDEYMADFDGEQKIREAFTEAFKDEVFSDVSEVKAIPLNENLFPKQKLTKWCQDFDNRCKKILNNSDYYEDLKNWRALSLTCDPKEVLMWSHYADEHKGVVCKFDFSSHEANNAIHKVNYVDVKESDSLKTIFKPFVKAWLKSSTTKYESLNKFLYSICHNFYEVGEFDISLKQFLIIKNMIWHKEKEHRFVYHINDKLDYISHSIDMDFLKFEKEHLKEVVFGIKTDEDEILKIKKYMNKQGFNVDFKKAINENCQLKIIDCDL
ncbi:DUF2971 domain-containing protein [Lentisphaerota bacterium WC36G]|nr:DUF2971 domain-containing protein [Lentisphaerae bacterium WC36]